MDAGKSTGPVDYKLKRTLEMLRKETTEIENLVYLYNNGDSRYASISDKEKKKRCKAANDLINESKNVQTDTRIKLEAKKAQNAGEINGDGFD